MLWQQEPTLDIEQDICSVVVTSLSKWGLLVRLREADDSGTSRKELSTTNSGMSLDNSPTVWLFCP